MSAPPENVKAWLEKAVEDLVSAKILIEHKPAILNTACFHCQQAAEKSLKSFLVFKEIEFEKLHNMNYLMNLCVKADKEFESLDEQAELLNPYAINVRYPGAVDPVSSEDAQEALNAATHIWNFVLGKLPSEYHLPNTLDK